jgi:hypothetical protein
MKIKKEYIILVAIIAVLSLYLAIHKPDEIHYQLPELSQIPQKEISKVEITKEAETVILIKKNDKWLLDPNQYPADMEKVKKILDVIADLSVTALVSESENYVRYELDENSRIHVKAYKGERLKREFYIGKTAPSFNHTFIRLRNDSKVYHARENFKSDFDQTVEAMRDKTVLTLEQNEIQEINIIKGDKQLTFAKKHITVEIKTDKETKKEKTDTPPETSPVWQDASGKNVGDSKVNNFLSTMKNLRCNKYLEGKIKDELKEPIYIVHFKGVEDHSLSIFAKEKDEDYPAISSQNGYAFVLESSTADKILSTFDEKKEEKSHN